MIIKRLLLLVLFSSLMASSTKIRFEDERHHKIHNMIGKFTKKMGKKGFSAIGIGEGVDHDSGKQNYLEIVFYVDHLSDIEYARKIETETICNFLESINSEEDIHSFLAEYPFSLKNITICFLARNGEEGLFSVSNFENELCYCKHDLNKPMTLAEEVYTETFEEALEIVGRE